MRALNDFTVLNMSHNQLKRIGDHVNELSNLKALILNHNQIKKVDDLAALSSLNTIGKVVSRRMFQHTDKWSGSPISQQAGDASIILFVIRIVKAIGSS